MTSPSMRGGGDRTVTSGVDAPFEPTTDEGEGTGWLLFAGTVIGLAGFMRIIDSMWAFHYKGALPDGVTLRDGLLGSSLETYAWTWLIVGLVLIAASGLILFRSQFARWIGYFAAAIGALSAMTWMPYYPIWSLAYVAVAVMVFYALARYGGRDGA
jgi:hypothetical protein